MRSQVKISNRQKKYIYDISHNCCSAVAMVMPAFLCLHAVPFSITWIYYLAPHLPNR